MPKDDSICEVPDPLINYRRVFINSPEKIRPRSSKIYQKFARTVFFVKFINWFWIIFAGRFSISKINNNARGWRWSWNEYDLEEERGHLDHLAKKQNVLADETAKHSGNKTQKHSGGAWCGRAGKVTRNQWPLGGSSASAAAAGFGVQCLEWICPRGGSRSNVAHVGLRAQAMDVESIHLENIAPRRAPPRGSAPIEGLSGAASAPQKIFPSWSFFSKIPSKNSPVVFVRSSRNSLVLRHNLSRIRSPKGIRLHPLIGGGRIYKNSSVTYSPHRNPIQTLNRYSKQKFKWLNIIIFSVVLT